MEGLFTVLPESVTLMMIDRGASGTDWSVVAILAHHRGDNNEIGVSRGGYVMSSQDVSDYSRGLLDADAVRRALSRMVRKGILVRSRRVKRGKTWLTVYAYAPYEMPHEPSDVDDGASAACEPVAELPHVGDSTSGNFATPPVAELPHSPISTPIESPTAPNHSPCDNYSRLESFSDENDRRPKREYPR